MEEEILTIEEVAKYLRVSERTVYDWAQKGEIPAGKIGTVWRFKKSEIEKWVNERLSSGSRLSSPKMAVQVKNILSTDRVIFIKRSRRLNDRRRWGIWTDYPIRINRRFVRESVQNGSDLM